jgi:diaminopimelate epimerase
MPTEFFKYHGLGNDFVVLDRTKGGGPPTAEEARALCDRHFGVGADGVLTLLPAAGADFRMHIRNADGSEAEMCGNGIRCAAKHGVDFGLAAGPEVRIATAGGTKVCTVEPGADGRVASVAVDMGAPVLDRPAIPVAGEGRMVAAPVAVGERTFAVTAVSLGNPHAVIFGGPEEATVEFAARFGPELETRTDLFPRKTNVEFAAVGPAGIDVAVWERGCGITLACGTGACATAVAAVVNGLAEAGRELGVRLPGGALGITVAPDLARVRMRGPAVLVFRGTLEPVRPVSGGGSPRQRASRDGTLRGSAPGPLIRPGSAGARRRRAPPAAGGSGRW